MKLTFYKTFFNTYDNNIKQVVFNTKKLIKKAIIYINKSNK